MHKPRICSMLIASFILIFISLCHAGWSEHGANDQRALIKRRNSNNEGHSRFMVLMQNGSVVYGNNAKDGELHLRKKDGTKIVYEEDQSIVGISIIHGAKKSTKDRQKLYRDAPILTSLVNMKSHGGELSLMHRFNSNQGQVRIVQYLDEKLRVVRSWEDSWPGSWGKKIREPLAISDDGHIIAQGEKGELRIYSQDGTILNRVVSPGVFNKKRIIDPQPISEEARKYLTKEDVELYSRVDSSIAEHETAALLERDKSLPDPTMLSGESFPKEIEDMEFAGDKRLLVLDDQSTLYLVDLSSLIVEPLKIEGWKMISNEEKPYQVRVVGNYLLVLTNYRVIKIELQPQLRVVNDARLPQGVGGPLTAWTAAPVLKQESEPGQEIKGIRIMFDDRRGMEPAIIELQ